MFARGIYLFLLLILAIGSAPLHAATISIEKEPAELVRLRQSYELEKKTTLQPIDSRYQKDLATVEKLSTNRPELKQAIISEYDSEKKAALQKVNTKYINQLDALEKNLIQKRDLKGALLVQEEKKRVSSGAPAPVASVQPSAPTPAPAPKPAAKKPGPFSYKSETEGFAGAPEFSKNNVYKFNMNEVRANTKLTIYASGRSSTNTYGDIYCITPTGQRSKIYDWSPGDFDESVKDVRSYKKLKPIVIMLSPMVSRPGTYQIAFEWQKGIDPLIIKSVELVTW